MRKTRIVAGYQQLVRIDRERPEPISDQGAESVLAAFESFAAEEGDKALVLADYGKGCIDPISPSWA